MGVPESTAKRVPKPACTRQKSQAVNHPRLRETPSSAHAWNGSYYRAIAHQSCAHALCPSYGARGATAPLQGQDRVGNDPVPLLAGLVGAALGVVALPGSKIGRKVCEGLVVDAFWLAGTASFWGTAQKPETRVESARFCHIGAPRVSVTAGRSARLRHIAFGGLVEAQEKRPR